MRADGERGDGDADEQAHLLPERRGADEVAGFQILRGGAGDGGGDADDSADHEREHAVVGAVQPATKKMAQVAISVAMLMPLIGFEELPRRPLMRAATVTKRKPKTTTKMPAKRL